MHNFKSALRDTILVLLFVVIIVLVIFEGYFRTSQFDYQDAAVRQDLAGSIDTVVCGASQGMDSFIPPIYNETFNANCYNLSCAMMTMKGRYVLLKKEIDRNPIRTVFLELSSDSLTRNRDEEFPEGDIYELGRWDTLGERIRFFINNIRFSEYSMIFHDTFHRSITSWQSIIKQARSAPAYEDTLGYKPLDSTDISLTLAEAEALYHSDHLTTDLNEENILYFRKIYDLCKQKDIRLILITVPISEPLLFTFDNYDDAYKQIADIAEEYQLEFYDFNLYKNYRYSPIDCFANENHMSRIGATLFTEDLIYVLEASSHDEDINDLFYDTYVEAIDVMYSTFAVKRQMTGEAFLFGRSGDI